MPIPIPIPTLEGKDKRDEYGEFALRQSGDIALQGTVESENHDSNNSYIVPWYSARMLSILSRKDLQLQFISTCSM